MVLLLEKQMALFSSPVQGQLCAPQLTNSPSLGGGEDDSVAIGARADLPSKLLVTPQQPRSLVTKVSRVERKNRITASASDTGFSSGHVVVHLAGVSVQLSRVEVIPGNKHKAGEPAAMHSDEAIVPAI
jgi:ribosomal protein S12